MIITRTPYRVSFFGGASDYSAWYQEHGGCVLTTTIDKYLHLSARFMPPFLGTKYRVMWSKIEAVNSRAEIQHAGVRGCLEYLGIDEGFEINHAGDLPARSGLGSSSGFTVGMLHALHALQGRHIPKPELARQAIEVEQEVLKETVGIQDQIECAYGGLNLIEIERDGTWHLRPVILPAQRLYAFQAHCMLYFTGLQRHASEIAKEQVQGFASRAPALKAMQAMAPQGLRILTDSGPLERFGELLHDGWLIKRGLSEKVSSDEIDETYRMALQAGAIGGKLLGAGGGGFMLLFARPSDQPRVRAAMEPLLEVPVVFERSGTQIIHSS